MSGFIIGFWILLLLCGLLFWYTRQTIPSIGDANFRKFQRTYLVVYLFATGEYKIFFTAAAAIALLGKIRTCALGEVKFQC
jgi:hypothetical protein